MTRDALGLAVAAVRGDLDQAARRFEHQARLRLLIGTMPVSSSTVATQIELEPDIGGVSSRLHDDEAHLRARDPSAAPAG